MAGRKLIYIDPDEIIFFLNQRWLDTECMQFFRLEGFDECSVVGVNFDPSHNAFAICLESEFWDEVPVGQMLPVLPKVRYICTREQIGEPFAKQYES